MENINKLLLATLLFSGVQAQGITLSGHLKRVTYSVLAYCGKKSPQEKANRLLFKAITADEIEAALNAGANINSRDESGRTALFGYALWNHLSAVKKFLAQGGDVNAKDNFGDTAICDSVVYALNTEVLSLLLKHGADPTANNNSAVKHCVLYGKKEKAVMLVKAGAKLPKDFYCPGKKCKETKPFVLELMRKKEKQTKVNA